MAPVTLSITCPLLRIRTAGIDLILNLSASRGFSWVLTCTTTPFPASSPATVCTTGAKSRQCGHQGAQNSARIGPGYVSAKESKFRSVSTTGLV